MNNEKSWIGFDLDGTLAFEEAEWQGFEHIGKPIKSMVDKLKAYLKQGKTVKIVTARVNQYNELDNYVARIHICQWLCKQGLYTDIDYIEIVSGKDMYMEKLYDNHVVQVETNTGRIIDDNEKKV